MNGERHSPDRQARQRTRQREITRAVTAEGAIRIEDLAERFAISVMTVHRDLDELQARGLLRKERGVATATATALVESSDVYRMGQQQELKERIALAALDFIEPGQAVMLDDATTTLRLVPLLRERLPLTVITNTLTVMQELKEMPGVTLLSLGGQFRDWCSAFVGRMTLSAINKLRVDVSIMSTSAITDGIAFHQSLEIVDVKRAMFDCARKRVLLADHTKFSKRALYMMLPLRDFDAVVVDPDIDPTVAQQLHDSGVELVIAGGNAEPAHQETGPA